MVHERERPASGRRPRSLEDACQFVKGVGPSRAESFRRLGIENVNDLLTHFPRTYYDRRRLAAVARLQPGVEETFVARVLTVTQRGPFRRRSILTAAVGDDTGIVQVVWFNQPFLARHLKPGRELVVSGRLTFYRGQRQIVNPEFELLGDEADGTSGDGPQGKIVPVYRLTSGVTQRYLRSVIRSVLDGYAGSVQETLPRALVDELRLPSRVDALRAMHFPEDEEAQAHALERMKLEELFYMQLILSLQRARRLEHATRPRLATSFGLERRFFDGQRFTLTRAQERVLDEIHGDLSTPRGMNRLLQGDVGSGKTIVAGAAMLAAVEAGCQSAMMVPTEILAIQHFRTLVPHMERLGVRMSLLVGSLKAPDKKRVREGLKDGTIQMVVGTHALIQADVSFKKLALVVIDEQHRFGVRQRAALVADDPHILVMTATPIPRTLALTAYADLDLSVIDEMPPGRAPVKTRVVPPEKRESMYAYIRERQAAGEQAYLLYPVIEETEKQDMEAAESAFADLSAGPLKGVPMAILHGRMSMSEKDEVMNAFHAGVVRVLVATTVVEVGVHVPQATIMAVHHAERFGLSQLHQLRGRVGRGGREGFCFLLVGDGASPEAMDRLGVLVREADGFRIAEEDLRIRGPGEFLGTRQHGVPGFRVANPLRDRALVERASVAVKSLLETDARLSGPDGRLCRDHLRAVLSEDVAAGAFAVS
ncbi:MAG TPA: ATP-dependent DNA helicase RecG [Candidatus Krumholzibacteria bacterium]|nr:ATP-dependent DNA helicase RecG [Candidatus Krumholzibacteria bacterium]